MERADGRCSVRGEGEMPSTWGKRHGLPKYDEFRTGLTYSEVYNMLRTSRKHSQKRKGSVLGFWHELKQQLYERAVDLGYLDEDNARAAVAEAIGMMPEDEQEL